MDSLVMGALEKQKQYKYPFYLLGLYVTFLLSTVCLAARITQIGPLLEPGGIFIFPLTFCICDIVGEVYGYAYPRLFIWVGVLAEIVFSLITIVVSHLPAPGFFSYAEAYQIVFDPTIRYVGAGLVGLLVGEFLNVYLLAKWKVRWKGKFFIWRAILATALGQACLTIIVDVLNYYGKLSMDGLGRLMLSGYLWKMGCAGLMVIPAWQVVKYLKKVEKVDHYDVNTNFNPFILGFSSNCERNKRDTNIEYAPQ